MRQKQFAVPDGTKVVSFDLFDTLVRRPFVHPTDLFRLIENVSGRTGFADARIRTESDTRKAIGHGICLEDIYNRLTGYGDLKEKECQAEIELSQPIRPTIDLLEGLDDDYRIVIATDMYLPRGVITEILKKFNINYDRLYISSEIKAAKHDGSMFARILEDYSISPKELLHVGDNRYADIRTPRRMGINTFFIESPMKRYLREHYDERRFQNQWKSLTSSIIVAIDSMRDPTDDVRYDIGNRYGGPIVYGYTRYLGDNIRDDSVLLFASRDGYTLQKSMDIMYPGHESHYVYVQRLFSKVLYDPMGDIDIPNRITDRMNYLKVINRLRMIISFFRNELDVQGTPIDDDELIRIYRANREKLILLRDKKFEEYTDRIRSICRDEDVDLIDCTTMRHSSQKLLQKILGRDVLGHNLITLRDFNEGLPFDSMYEWKDRFFGWSRVDIPEYLLCSPELPILGWDGNSPVYDENAPDCERQRTHDYPMICEGELDYVRGMISVFGQLLPSMDYRCINDWVMLSMAKGTPYREHLRNVEWASGADHHDWGPIIPWDGLLHRLKRLAIDILSRNL